MGLTNILLGILVTTANASFCSYFGNRKPGYEPDLRRCGTYRGNSCCQPDEEDISFNVDPIFHGQEGSDCQATVNLLRCWICHPQQNMFYRNEMLTVCEDMCNRMLGHCGGALWRDGRVRDYYGNGTALCREMGFNVSNTNCFTASSAGVKHTPGKLGTLIALFAGVLLTGLLTRSSQLNAVIIGIIVTTVLLAHPSSAQDSTRAQEVVQWAERISLFINELASDQLLAEDAQALFDNVEYNEVPVNGSEVVEQIRERLATFAEDKLNALNRMATTVADEYNRFIRGTREQPYGYPEELPASVYRDSDASDHLPYDQLTFDRRFQYFVNLNQSSVKITSSLDRTNDDLLTQINVSAALDPIFKENLANDPFISYQFFGSSRGFLRVFPGRPWQRNVIGFREDFDPRFRPWFVAATSGPKDVVIIVDTSRSMGEFVNARLLLNASLGATISSLYITIADDSTTEGNEQFYLTIDFATVSDDMVLGNLGGAVVTIVDDDITRINFDDSTYSIDEYDGAIHPVLILSNPVSTDVTVKVLSTDGSADGYIDISSGSYESGIDIYDEGEDYSSGPYYITLAAGITRISFNVSILDDKILEEDEKFILTIDPSSLPCSVTTGDHNQATVIILEDESESCIVSTISGNVEHNRKKESTVLKFEADNRNATYACKLDRENYKSCTSPVTWNKLSKGKHSVTVRARCIIDGVIYSATRIKIEFQVR